MILARAVTLNPREILRFAQDDKVNPVFMLADIVSKKNPRSAFATIRKGKRDVREGRVVSHEKTARWLRSWGTKRELPPPACEQSGRKLRAVQDLGAK